MNIAVIGLGAMGSRIAHRLLGSGYKVTVWNRTAERADPLAGQGAVVAASPAEAAGSADQVVTVLSDEPALMEVATGPGGLVEGMRPGQVLVEMSTVGPAAVRRLRERLPGEIDLVDAPVLGSVSEVEAGTLLIFAGGEAAAVDKVGAVLDALGTSRHMGPLGTGAAAKLVANSTLVGTLTLLGEVVALGRGLGLDDDQTFEVLSATPLAGQAERRRDVAAGTEVPVRFRLVLALKDAALVAAEAERTGVEARLLDDAMSWFGDAVEADEGELDYSAIVRHIAGTAAPPPG